MQIAFVPRRRTIPAATKYARGERIRIKNVPAISVTKIVAYFEAFSRNLSEKTQEMFQSK
jgi:hypothetical protein